MRKSTVPLALGLCMIVGGTLLPLAAYVATDLMPRKYTSACTIEVKDTSSIPDPHFVAKQVQILQSTAVLLPVIDQLKLVEKWSAGLPAPMTGDQAYDRVVSMVRAPPGVQQVRDTDMITIPATSTDRQEAADIANAIARVYVQIRKDDLNQRINNSLQELNMEVEKLREDVRKAKDELNKIRSRDIRTDPNPESLESDDMEAERELIDKEQKLNEAKQKVEQLKTQLDNAADPEKKDLQAQLSAAQGDLENEQKLYDAANAKVQQNRSASEAEYTKAKENYINAKRLLDAAETKLQVDRTELQIELMPAKIWDRAEPAPGASSPNVFFCVAVSACIGFFFAVCGMILFIIGLRLKAGEAAVSTGNE